MLAKPSDYLLKLLIINKPRAATQIKNGKEFKTV